MAGAAGLGEAMDVGEVTVAGVEGDDGEDGVSVQAAPSNDQTVPRQQRLLAYPTPTAAHAGTTRRPAGIGPLLLKGHMAVALVPVTGPSRSALRSNDLA